MFHGRIKEVFEELYLEDRSHEDRESSQEEHKDTGDSLLPGEEK